MTDIFPQQTRNIQPLPSKPAPEKSTTLPAAAPFPELNESSFEKEVRNGKGVMLVEVGANWCGPCKKMVPILTELGATTTRKDGTPLPIFKVDADKSEKLADSLNISVLPTMIFFVDGKETGRMTGTRSLADLKSALNNAAR
jgi:thioredoxin 1